MRTQPQHGKGTQKDRQAEGQTNNRPTAGHMLNVLICIMFNIFNNLLQTEL